MYQKAIHLVCSVLLLGLAGSALADMVAYYPMDEGSGTNVADASGSGHDGVIEGTVEWVEGAPGFGMGIDFPGVAGTTWVNTGTWDPSADTGALTVAVWFKVEGDTGTYQGLLCKSRDAYEAGNMQFQFTLSADLEIGFAGSYAFWQAYGDPVALGEWHHAAFSLDGDTVEVFRDGVSVRTNSTNIGLNPDLSDGMVLLGASQVGRMYVDGFPLDGVLDEVYFFNHAMTAEEIVQVMEGDFAIAPGAARAPTPANKAVDVPRDSILRWTPGEDATMHDVYFGISFDDVNAASRQNPGDVLLSQGQSASTCEPGRLELGQTCYWRVDEVSPAPDSTIVRGKVWSFTVEPTGYKVANTNVTVTASIPTDGSSPDPNALIDGSGLDENGQHSVDTDDMWLGKAPDGETPVLTFAFDRVYKLDAMHVWNFNSQVEFILGFGFKDVTLEYSLDGESWMVLGDFVLDRAPGLATDAGQTLSLGGIKAQYVRMTANSSHGGIAQQGLSEVAFFSVPVRARGPQPADGATDVDVNTVLNWRTGREAASEQVHLGTDANAVADGTALIATVTGGVYDPGTLDLGTTYFWRIEEVNEAESIGLWSGDTWSFSTPQYILIDGFESYTDDEGQEIFSTWADGYDDNANGSQVGHDNPPYAEETIVHSGEQAMPMRYGQGNATTSEATMTPPAAQDWTAGGATTLVLYFHGDVSNAPGQVYVKINGTRVDYPGGTAGLAAPLWKQWNIDLAGLGNAAKNVSSMTIGVAGSGTGLLYVDDIRLYREAPPMAGPAVDPGTANLMALYSMEDSLADASGKGYNGTAEVGSSFGPGLPGYGKALVLDGTSGHATLPIGPLVQSLSSATFATWVNWTGSGSQWCRIFDFGTGETVYMFLTPNSGGSSLRFAITTTSSGGESQLNRAGILSGGWHHLAVALDGAAMTMQMYLDGELVDSDTTNTLPSDLGATTQNYLGRSQWDDPYLPGSIDDFRIYNRALSEAEVRYLVGDR